VIFSGPVALPPAMRCLVAIELKVGEFRARIRRKDAVLPRRAGRRVRLPEENPSIGIILCKTKSRTIVQYALRDARKPIGVATYRLVKRLPRELKGQLPTPEEITRLLEAMP